MFKVSSIFGKKNNQLSNKKNSYNHFLKEKEEMHNKSKSYFYGIGNPVWSMRNYQEFAEEAYIKNVIAHRAIQMIAQCAASVSLKLYNIIDGDKHIVNNHPILKILRNPNSVLSGKEFFESVYIYRLLSGNVYILSTKAHYNCNHGKNTSQAQSYHNRNENKDIEQNYDYEDLKLYVLRPDRVQIISGEGFMPLGYRYTVDDHYVDYPIDQFNGRSQILHIKNFNPSSDWYGLSSIEAAAYSIDQHNQASAWNQALLQNGARPSGAIIVKNADGKPSMLSESEKNSLRSSIDECFSGPHNSGRPILLEGGLEWREMSLSPKDMDYIESKNNAAREIALGLGVPPQMLGIPGDYRYHSDTGNKALFWEHTVIPLLNSTMSGFNKLFSQYFGENLLLTYDLNDTSPLTDKINTTWDRVRNSNFMTINEKRIAVGLSPIDDEKYNRIK